MGMETRGNHRYYYRKERQGVRVVSTYLGNGATAQLIAECEYWRRVEERQERAAVKREQRTVEEQAARVLGTEANLRELVKAVLIANGFHQHKRQWRRRPMEQDATVNEQPATTVVMVDPEVDRRREGFQALRAALAIEAQPDKKGGKITEVARAIAERDKRAAVRKVLAEYPCIWDGLRHMLSSGQRAIIEALCGGAVDSATGQLLEKSMLALRDGLGYEHAPPLEKLMIEQIVFAWADLEYVQMHYAKSAFGSHTLTSGAYWDRRVAGAQARYLRAMEVLARVRRLAMPQPLQVNIGGQQVNVAGGRSIGANGEAP